MGQIDMFRYDSYSTGQCENLKNQPNVNLNVKRKQFPYL